MGFTATPAGAQLSTQDLAASRYPARVASGDGYKVASTCLGSYLTKMFKKYFGAEGSMLSETYHKSVTSSCPGDVAHFAYCGPDPVRSLLPFGRC